MNTSLRIGDPEINVSAQALYKGSEELPEIIESVKATSYVKNVDWSEAVKVVGNNNTDARKIIQYLILDHWKI
jgi:hypothetical protein